MSDTPESHAKRLIERYTVPRVESGGKPPSADREHVVQNLAGEGGMREDDARRIVNELERRGEIYEPEDGRVRLTRDGRLH